MTTLTLHPVDTTEHFEFPHEMSGVTPRSPALNVLIDFMNHEPLVIDGWMSAVDAERQMRQSHTPLRIVVDHASEFIGTISLEDLCEPNLLRQVAAGSPRDHIQVIDLMRHRCEIQALAYDDLVGATVGDLVDILCSHSLQYCLVMDSDGRRIRGLIIASDIGQRLSGVDLSAAPTFAGILAAIRHYETH